MPWQSAYLYGADPDSPSISDHLSLHRTSPQHSQRTESRVLVYVNISIYIICQLVHNANSAHALVVNLNQFGTPTWFLTLSAADVIQTRAKQWSVLYTDEVCVLSFII